MMQAEKQASAYTASVSLPTQQSLVEHRRRREIANFYAKKLVEFSFAYARLLLDLIYALVIHLFTLPPPPQPFFFKTWCAI